MPDQDDKRVPDTESKRILDRVSRESAAGGMSVVERAKGHFSARDADAGDTVEIWGTRIGRFLGLIALIAMFIWLLSSIFGRA